MKEKTIILGITASIAAYKAAEIARQLSSEGVGVYPVLTQKANDFIGGLTLEALTGKEVGVQKGALNYFKYLKLAKEADLILVAPATANFIAHLANGFASDLLETIVLARGCSLLLAPAMNKNMWTNKITQENVKKLKGLGAEFIDPRKGHLACGEEGIGRLAEVDDIVRVCTKKLH